MSNLQVRRVSFEFAGGVPFNWQPENPEFGTSMNIISMLILGFEKYAVSAMRAAMPRITDPGVAAEADGFLRQEAQHARAHRAHIRALTADYPGLQGILDKVVASYDELFDSKPLDYHLAYVAGLEATFTPMFKMFLDHEDELFQPGDERVASLFLWHFVEEIEHRASALIVYNHVVGRKWYRLGQLPSVVRHLGYITSLICDGFNEFVPVEDRKVDARCILPARRMRRQLAERIPLFALGVDTRYPMWTACVPRKEENRTWRRILGSQSPNHDPEHQPLPEFAGQWRDRYDSGDDIASWYSSRRAG
jgi:predicted metal-dependent hydrolase